MTRIIQLDEQDRHSTEECIALASQALAAGEVIAIPTDTVYGLAVAINPKGIYGGEKLFRIKGRSESANLPVLVSGLDQAESEVAVFSETGLRLANAFWPGALTLIAKRHPGLKAYLGENVETVGVRCPESELIRGICERIGPIATTSANRHGSPPLDSGDAIAEEFLDEIDLLVNYGKLFGIASTIVDVSGEEIRMIREGGIGVSQIKANSG